MRIIRTALALLLVTASAAAAQPPSSAAAKCSPDDVARTTAAIGATRTRLLALQIGDDDVYPAAQQAIADMRDEVDSFVQAYMRCAVHRPDPSSVIKSQLSLAAYAWKAPGDEPWTRPDDSGAREFKPSFDVRLFQNPRRIGVTATFPIACGQDTVLLLFMPDHDSWREVLRWQKSEPFALPGTGSFDYAASPADKSGRWFVVTRDAAPGCANGTWSGIHYSVLRPEAEPWHPKVLFSRSEGMYFGLDDFGSLTIERDAFDLRFESASIDSGYLVREWIRHYSVVGDAVRRTQPVAVSPRDFVDEWIVSPWTEAERWSSKSALTELRQAHVDWTNRRARYTESLIAYESVHRCSDRRDHYQIEIGEHSVPDYTLIHSSFFEVSANGDFTMLRVSDRADARCQGPDLSDEMATW